MDPALVNATVQFGCAHVAYIAASTRRWARLTVRCSVRLRMVPSASTSTAVIDGFAAEALHRRHRHLDRRLTVSRSVSGWRPAHAGSGVGVDHDLAHARSRRLSGLTAVSTARIFSCSNGTVGVRRVLAEPGEVGVDHGVGVASRIGSEGDQRCFHPRPASVHRFTDDTARCRSASSTSLFGRVRDLMSAINALSLRSKSRTERCASANSCSEAASTSNRSSSVRPSRQPCEHVDVLGGHVTLRERRPRTPAPCARSRSSAAFAHQGGTVAVEEGVEPARRLTPPSSAGWRGGRSARRMCTRCTP